MKFNQYNIKKFFRQSNAPQTGQIHYEPDSDDDFDDEDPDEDLNI